MKWYRKTKRKRENTMTIINLTPHDVKICNDGGEVVATYPKSGTVARVATNKQIIGEIDGVVIKAVSYGAIDNLPTPADGVVYIVSMVVAQAARGRSDLVSPDTAPDAAVRDAAGLIVGVKNFARY